MCAAAAPVSRLGRRQPWRSDEVRATICPNIRANCLQRQLSALGWVLAVCTVLAAHAPHACAEVRALVVGADYRNASDSRIVLINTLVDAAAVARLLRDVRVTDVQYVENPSGPALADAVERFAGRLTAADVALLYYAGHAIQVAGQNYLIAADGNTLIAAEQILSRIMPRARGSVFIIDACRNNPFVRKSDSESTALTVSYLQPQTRELQTLSRDELESSAAGLSQIGNLRGTNAIVFFSTDPGNVALDGAAGQGSPFAHAIVKELGKRQSLDAAIRKVTAAVSKATNAQQSPWRQGDLGFPLFLAGQPSFPVP